MEQPYGDIHRRFAAGEPVHAGAEGVHLVGLFIEGQIDQRMIRVSGRFRRISDPEVARMLWQTHGVLRHALGDLHCAHGRGADLIGADSEPALPMGRTGFSAA